MLLPKPKSIDGWHPSDEFDPLTYEKVVGLNNLLSISWLNKGVELAAPVARLGLSDGGVGTGFLITPDLLITNNHVLPDKGSVGETTIEFNYQKTWEGDLEPVQRYELDGKRFRTNEHLDYTIVRVDGAPGDLFGYIDVIKRADPSVNDFVSIIQHPFGGPKQISFTDNKVSAVFGERLQYATDTEPGSSGSPVFNQEWQLVGLHHAGGGLAGPDGKKHFTNEGIVIGAIVRDAATFLGLSDSLYDLAFSDLRSLLVRIVTREDLLAEPTVFAATALRQTPRFGIALKDWLTLNAPPGDRSVEHLAVAGVAIGGALRQWARTEGREAIPEAAMSDPAPPTALYKAMDRFRGSSALPADVYTAVVGDLARAPALVRPIVKEIGQEEGVVAMCAAFLVGVTVGAEAYDSPSERVRKARKPRARRPTDAASKGQRPRSRKRVSKEA